MILLFIALVLLKIADLFTPLWIFLACVAWLLTASNNFLKKAMLDR